MSNLQTNNETELGLLTNLSLQEVDLSMAVREKMARCMRQWSILVSTTTVAESSSEEEQQAVKQKRAIKSVRTADSTISKRATWPHEMVYIVAGKPTFYDEISLVLFINGYLIVMKGE